MFSDLSYSNLDIHSSVQFHSHFVIIKFIIPRDASLLQLLKRFFVFVLYVSQCQFFHLLVYLTAID